MSKYCNVKKSWIDIQSCYCVYTQLQCFRTNCFDSHYCHHEKAECCIQLTFNRLKWMQLCAKFQLSGTRGSGDIQIPIFCRVGRLGWSASADLPETWCEALHELKTHMLKKSSGQHKPFSSCEIPKGSQKKCQSRCAQTKCGNCKAEIE